ncbi:hypothetical protein PVE_R2G0544 [Pseudomonas veronii 1YdBTEX2]|mgnify:CR=1 FL=1|uniref:Uncharacterized protein n=1 Tax=Pseudomonas veronii 1YdBTEX2 TaxID=1295141 RepID=A0A1D3K880_PSEVE|nr:hypothetical protein [Pseudomonas sp. AP19]OEC63820.1 hypothetical protein A7D21_28480 [Pseudomonas sp. AP19]SBW84569.1 hypothetical protein PVE_R2G0544 [Pseudomonas veronii 1YdBTEX2]
MNKAELSKMLEGKVAEKLQDGYEILNYAMDAASRDKLRRDLKIHGHNIPHEDGKHEEWQNYLWQVEHGLYRGEAPPKRVSVETLQPGEPANAGELNSTSAGLWKARRH